MDLIAGLDLGQSRDYSGLVVVERLDVEPARSWGRFTEERHVRHIERFALGTPYPAVVERVCELMREPEMRQAKVVIDATGVGRGIVDLFRDAHKDGYLPNWPVPITITAGIHESGLSVPKRDLVARLQALMQTDRLRIAAGLPLAEVLTRELLAFRAKISAAGKDTYEAMRESDHDDLVVALSLACWYPGNPNLRRFISHYGRVFDSVDEAESGPAPTLRPQTAPAFGPPRKG